MSAKAMILPTQQVDQVGSFVERELRDVAEYSNRDPYDGSMVSALMNLAAEIYEAGYAAGVSSANAVSWSMRRVERTRRELESERTDHGANTKEDVN